MITQITPAEHLQRIAYAAAIVLGPAAFFVGAIFEPATHVPTGAENIALNMAADPFTNGLHVGAFVLASFLLPISIIGMARLAMARSPWLATIGGALGLAGWLPLAALAAQDDMTLQMARLGQSTVLATLWERFNADATMTVLLITYIVGHLAAYVVLPIALRRARLIPAWSAWLVASTTPLTLALFATRNHSALAAQASLAAFGAAWILGSLPIALAVLSSKKQDAAAEIGLLAAGYETASARAARIRAA